MLQGGAKSLGGAGQSGGSSITDNFFKALGNEKMGQGAGKIGLQYANSGLGSDQPTNMMGIVNSMGNQNQQTQQQRPQISQINPLLQMLMSGGK
jgi:hypothetical protein